MCLSAAADTDAAGDDDDGGAGDWNCSCHFSIDYILISYTF